MLLQHHVPAQDGGVIGAGEVGGNGKAHRPVRRLKGLGKGGGGGTGGGGGGLLLGHGPQKLGDLQRVVVDELPLAHLEPQGDRLKEEAPAVKLAHAQIAAAVAYNFTNHTTHPIIWFLISCLMLSYRIPAGLSTENGENPENFSGQGAGGAGPTCRRGRKRGENFFL